VLSTRVNERADASTSDYTMFKKSKTVCISEPDPTYKVPIRTSYIITGYLYVLLITSSWLIWNLELKISWMNFTLVEVIALLSPT